MSYFGTLTPRMQHFRENLLESTPQVCVDRAIITTRVYKEYAAQPLALKRAIMLREVLAGMKIFIEPETLLAGNQASANRAAPIFPEYAMKWVIDELDEFEKRDGDRLGFPVFPLEWHDPKTGDVSSGYRESGYLPEAVINFLALLGWNPGTDQEILSMDDLIAQFDLTKCSKSGARFDYVKGQWFNREYILASDNVKLVPEFAKILSENGINETPERLAAVIGMMKMKKINFIHELWPLCDFFFIRPEYSMDDKFTRKNWKEGAAAEMQELVALLEGLDDFSVESQKAVVDAWAEAGDKRPWTPWRVCLVGTGKGPDMYELAEFLGKDETLARMRAAIEKL